MNTCIDCGADISHKRIDTKRCDKCKRLYYLWRQKNKANEADYQPEPAYEPDYSAVEGLSLSYIVRDVCLDVRNKRKQDQLNALINFPE